MFSSSYLAWGFAGALIFGLTLLFSIRNGAIVAAGCFLGFLAGWAISFAFMPAFDPWLGQSVILFLVLFGGAALLALSGDTSRAAGPMVLWVLLAIVAAAVSFASTFSGFHADRYAKLLVPVQESRMTGIPLIDQSQARLVTDELARKRAAEMISASDEQGIGSRVVIGEMWGNEINKTMYWIAPLEHSSFLRWFSFGTTPGYIMVSQFNEVNAKFVQDQPIKIGKQAWFSDNVYRRVYMEGLIDYEYGDAMFQVDDSGHPYWVVPLLYPQVGMGGYMPVKWALVDATTGAVQTFDDPAKIPAWVDRVYPQDIVAQRFDDWGCLGQGWIACTFTGQNVITSTPDISVTIDPDDHIVYYSGTQFANTKAEGASSGVYVANARTGRTVFYPRAGITETEAQSVMTQAWSNYEGYKAAEPILLSVNGHEAYFSIILDAAGVRKGFAIVSQDNRNIIGFGNSVQSTVTEFSRSLQRSGRDSAFEPGKRAAEASVEGLVVTFTPYVQNGKTVFYVTIDTQPNKIFEVSDEKIGEIVATKVGDPVRVTSDNYQPGVVYVTGFDNLRFDLKEEGLQPKVDKSMKDARERYEEQKDRSDAKAIIERLNPEQLNRLLEALRATQGSSSTPAMPEAK